MEIQSIAADTAPMNEQTCNDLFEAAVDMAYSAFKQVTDDHVLSVYERLVWNQAHGLGLHDVVTLH